MTEQIIDDATRAAAIKDLILLDPPAEQAFDDIVYIAAQTCDAPIALVTILDRDRQWFKGRTGLSVYETPIDQLVCRLEIDHPAFLEIPDLARS